MFGLKNYKKNVVEAFRRVKIALDNGNTTPEIESSISDLSRLLEEKGKITKKQSEYIMPGLLEVKRILLNESNGEAIVDAHYKIEDIICYLSGTVLNEDQRKEREINKRFYENKAVIDNSKKTITQLGKQICKIEVSVESLTKAQENFINDNSPYNYQVWKQYEMKKAILNEEKKKINAEIKIEENRINSLSQINQSYIKSNTILKTADIIDEKNQQAAIVESLTADVEVAEYKKKNQDADITLDNISKKADQFDSLLEITTDTIEDPLTDPLYASYLKACEEKALKKSKCSSVADKENKKDIEK